MNARVALVVAGLLAVFGASYGVARALWSDPTVSEEPTLTLPAAPAKSATIRGASLTGSIPALEQQPTNVISPSAGTGSSGSTGGTGGGAGAGEGATGSGGTTTESSG